ncbi:MAG: hypothetical protein ACRDUY_09120 [Nitriliruptorales bacterium]
MSGRSTQEGFVALEFALGAGLLVVPVALLVLSFPGWVERRSAAQVAAHEAARTAVVAHDIDAARTTIQALVATIGESHGLEPSELEVCLVAHELGVPPPPCAVPPSLARGGAITAWVDVKIPVVRIPALDLALAETTLTVSHTERVDLYRSLP